jgi:butyrate kinase
MSTDQGGPIAVLAVNPGSTSTKVAVFVDGELCKSLSIEHDKAVLDSLGAIKNQLEYRLDAIKAALDQEASTLEGLTAVVGRGGLLRPMEGGVYEVNERMVEDALERPLAQHAANLGCALAFSLARERGLKSYIVDAVCTDEYEPEAKISGLPEIPRISFLHALSARASARRASRQLGIRMEDARFVVAHMGGGTTICSVKGGRLIDANNSNDEGPFTPERTGTLPAGSVVNICYSGKYSKSQLRELFLRKGGLFAYTGTNDAKEIIKRIAAGDESALDVMRAMAYQTAKEIGAYAAVLSGRLDAVLLTGGLANWVMFINELRGYISFLGKIIIYPGENEMQALGEGATLAVRGLIAVKKYL